MTLYQEQWERQKQRSDIPKAHLPVHRWYLRLEKPWCVVSRDKPGDNICVMRARNPGIAFYRFLYHTAGEDFLWGDRRRMPDAELLALIHHDDIHVLVMYEDGVPAGFFELSFRDPDKSEIKYFAMLPGFLGRGLGAYMLNQAIVFGGTAKLPLVLDTCTLDHHSALENYRKRGFKIYREEDEIYPDPRLDGIVPRGVGKHVPLAAT